MFDDDTNQNQSQDNGSDEGFSGGDTSTLTGSAPSAPPSAATVASQPLPMGAAPSGAPAPAGSPQDAVRLGFSPAPTDPGPAKPGLWAAILQGALTGMAGGGGKSFAQGLGTGAASEQNYIQQQKENAAQQQQLQFESLKAASSVALARVEAQKAELAIPEAKVALVQHEQEVNEYAEEHGQSPVFQIDSGNDTTMAAQATGGLQTLAAKNGGTIPQVTALQSPHTDDSPGHQITVYAPTVADIKANPNGADKTINDYRAVQGLPPLSHQNIMVAGGLKNKGNAYGGVQEMLADAQQGLFAVPPVSKDDAENNATSARMQQQIDNYQKLPADQQDAKVLSLLQSQKASFDAGVKGKTQSDITTKNTVTTGTSAADAAAAGKKAKAEELAKESTPGGQAELSKNQAEANKATFELGQEKREAAQIGAPDPTGFSSQLTAKEYDKRYDAFTKSKQYTTLQTLQGSYQQFQQVKSDLDAGKDMTGAQSVVGLFNAIGISATPLAGKGMRINQNTIEEHVGARGVDQAAYQKLLSLKNGDVITPKQLRDYSTIATQVYRDAYVNSVDEAHRQGLPADFLPKGGGQSLDGPTADIFSRSVLHTYPQLARNPTVLKIAIKEAAEGNGWKVE